MNIDWKKILAVIGTLAVLVGVAFLVSRINGGAKPNGIQEGLKNRTSTAAGVDTGGWKSVEGEGLMIKYPSELTLDSKALEIGWAISLSLGGPYFQGLVAPGGMNIDIVSNPQEKFDLEKQIDDDLRGTIIEATSTFKLSGIQGFKVFWYDEPSVKGGGQGVVVYLPRNGFLTKIFMDYNPLNEDQKLEFIRRLDQILSTIEFKS